MSDSKKILNLPDIDTSQPDTFETPDVPDTSSVNIQEPELVNENIERVSLVPSKAHSKFANRKFNNDGEDFSDSIYKKNNRVASNKRIQVGAPLLANQTEFDMLPNGQEKEESAMQKFQRLQYEVRTFREEMQSVVDSSADSEVETGIKAVELTHHLADLQSQLSLLLDNEKLLPILDENRQVLHYKQLQNESSKLLASNIKSFTSSNQQQQQQEGLSSASVPSSSSSSTADNHVKYELYYSGDQAKYQKLQRMVDLDKRLANIETLVGSKSELSIPLCQSLVEIRDKLNLLDSTKIDVLNVKLKNTMKQMETLKTQDESTTKAFTTNEKKIAEMFDTMNRWDHISSQLPSIINRLYTLRSLHEEGLSFTNHLSNLEKEQSNISSLLKTNSSLMNKMDDSFKNNMTTIQSNIELLEKRITEIQSKLNK
ncbi:dynactin 50 kDa subunit [Cavenderia fasciculata]|uniref:Dynactin 50 kDa subunit n=1 Tax=Cavenderia fasciculata TaxID=261658 RepID=F4Q9Q6_CACFS|nr:dynactin 50 kDa subunit [Cavenderia fasciculata]EGG15425.1 dynactin 50 kDa subunit [Cavenderia fasciculata]|eukprot:XP_004354167.1 dynactin 50 kDa subunit [Cavenderia fasciculata]